MLEDKKTDSQKEGSQKESNKEWLKNRKTKSKNPNKIKDTRIQREKFAERESRQ